METEPAEEVGEVDASSPNVDRHLSGTRRRRLEALDPQHARPAGPRDDDPLRLHRVPKATRVEPAARMSSAQPSSPDVPESEFVGPEVPDLRHQGVQQEDGASAPGLRDLGRDPDAGLERAIRSR